jgi:Na+/citrate or Na+/malate symporter
LVAVTTETLLGVAMPVMGGGVDVDTVALDPLQPASTPASTPATVATQAMPRSVIRNLFNLISSTSNLYAEIHTQRRGKG